MGKSKINKEENAYYHIFYHILSYILEENNAVTSFKL